MGEPLTKKEFCARFKSEMVRIMGEFDGEGESVAKYAEMTAPSYWDEPDQRAEGPEECAQADISYWGET